MLSVPVWSLVTETSTVFIKWIRCSTKKCQNNSFMGKSLVNTQVCCISDESITKGERFFLIKVEHRCLDLWDSKQPTYPWLLSAFTMKSHLSPQRESEPGPRSPIGSSDSSSGSFLPCHHPLVISNNDYILPDICRPEGLDFPLSSYADSLCDSFLGVQPSSWFSMYRPFGIGTISISLYFVHNI